jgi:hypothetical protein
LEQKGPQQSGRQQQQRLQQHGEVSKNRDPSNCWDASNSNRVDSISRQNDNRNTTDTVTALTLSTATREFKDNLRGKQENRKYSLFSPLKIFDTPIAKGTA